MIIIIISAIICLAGVLAIAAGIQLIRRINRQLDRINERFYGAEKRAFEEISSDKL